jgi:hypothetical protein
MHSSDGCRVVQCKAGEAIFKSECMPAYVRLAKERPGLMAFYGRLKEKVFPSGPSENWDESIWDPSKQLEVQGSHNSLGT